MRNVTQAVCVVSPVSSAHKHTHIWARARVSAIFSLLCYLILFAFVPTESFSFASENNTDFKQRSACRPFVERLCVVLPQKDSLEDTSFLHWYTAVSGIDERILAFCPEISPINIIIGQIISIK